MIERAIMDSHNSENTGISNPNLVKLYSIYMMLPVVQIPHVSFFLFSRKTHKTNNDRCVFRQTQGQKRQKAYVKNAVVLQRALNFAMIIIITLYDQLYFYIVLLAH